MKKYEVVMAHEMPEPTLPKPDEPVDPCFVTTQEGLPVIYDRDWLPMCGVRVIHPTNPKAPSINHGVTVIYLPPHTVLPLHSHETEETYAVLEGAGTFLYHDGTREVTRGDFVYLPPWCEHGLENTGRDVLVVLLATSPANP
jgi:mannose-6-phosphate isomerase-like protein (cupin superfamily)